ncbi:MAG: hypothetical protein J6S96_10200 [Muribaculaceae bacterium]|nr:hypothetical protein [Muribaculaceae bacterium]
MKKTFVTIVLAMLVALSVAAADYVTITGTSVRLRMKPSLQSETLTTSAGVNIHPKKGEKLECLGDAGDFYKVKYKGKVVYVSKKFAVADAAPVQTTAKQADGQRFVVVTGTGVRLRLEPSLNAKTLQRGGVNVHPKKGERIKLMGDAGDFYKVNYQGNYVYIHKDYAKAE